MRNDIFAYIKNLQQQLLAMKSTQNVGASGISRIEYRGEWNSNRGKFLIFTTNSSEKAIVRLNASNSGTIFPIGVSNNDNLHFWVLPNGSGQYEIISTKAGAVSIANELPL